ncbi:uncharacterized protein MELLADRAFT_90300 [Melampsora larici-populina 98AG31]|uniref:Uncharacterized protein n=1 Tax=Melampsora larici-populina (strain 98AG31 / pathotype 3-4-7) TaxID=747676 RepID=F4RWF8_MELLP|nr:uncharacterized protein MELLADRAFT_90300 [Melampsora larici-populina 98AG31]EGG03328.1 hypothetical protein MELLADRAFT_90300 [Melampsora larici-populina 98AG31]
MYPNYFSLRVFDYGRLRYIGTRTNDQLTSQTHVHFTNKPSIINYQPSTNQQRQQQQQQR